MWTIEGFLFYHNMLTMVLILPLEAALFLLFLIVPLSNQQI